MADAGRYHLEAYLRVSVPDTNHGYEPKLRHGEYVHVKAAILNISVSQMLTWSVPLPQPANDCTEFQGTTAPLLIFSSLFLRCS